MKLISRILLALITFLLLSMLMTSCYTKKQAINKFCHQDSVRVEIRIVDTVIVKEIKADTIFSINIDSVFIQKDKLQIKYLRKNDTIYLEGKCEADTIIKEIPVNISVPCNCPPIPELPWYIIARNWIIYFFAAIGFLVILLKGFNKAIGG
jgi:hypothetical protein